MELSWGDPFEAAQDGKQQWNGTLSKGEAQRDSTPPTASGRLAGERPDELNGRAVVVGGSKPRSLIVTSGNIVPTPGT